MTFESVSFGLFVLATLGAYWAADRSRELQKGILLTASAAFYTLFGWKFVVILAVSIGVNHWMAARVGPDRPTSLSWTRAAIAFNLGLLGVFKYYNFFRESLDDVLAVVGMSSHLPAFQILLPVGISFYSFQAIAYVVDVHRGAGPRARSLLDFALFQALFFQLLMGPICRAKALLPQIEAPAPARIERAPEAMALIATGLLKRMVLATALFNHGVAAAFFAPDNYTAASLWFTLLAYTVQIYCDFSGYTDIMRGVAMLMGFDIPDNFNNPYRATSLGEFWRRWHITFSNWLRDFIYLPLGGSRRGTLRNYFNLFMTMFVCGLWHGASWGFILWGSLHGLALVLYKADLEADRARGIDPKKAPRRPHELLRGWLWTMFVVCMSRIFFVTPDMATAALYLRGLVDLDADGAGIHHVLVLATAAGLAWNFVGDRIRNGHAHFAAALPRPAQLAFWGATLLFLLLVRPGGNSPTAYFGF